MMNIVFLLIILSLFVALMFLGAFFWAVRTGQYEDDYTPSMRILLDDQHPNHNNTINLESKKSKPDVKP